MLKKLRILTIVLSMIFTILGSASIIHATTIKVAFIGDSITVGYGTYAYPIRVGNMLGNAYEVRNYGVSGHTLLKQGDYPYWNTAEYTNSQAWNPDIVIIMLGTNDSKSQNWQYQASFISNYEEMINVYKNLSSHPKVYVNKVPKVYNSGNYGITDSVVQQVNDKIVQIAGDTASPLTDVYTATSGMSANFPDNVHPNDDGTQVIADAVYSTLNVAALNRTVNNTDSSITYVGSWTNSGSRGIGDYYDDVRYTSTAGDSASFTFVGKGIDFITEKYSDEGNVDIYIDGIFDQTVNCSNATRLSQQTVYNKTWATAGTHTIKIVKNSGSYMLLDAFKVYDSAVIVNDTNSSITYASAWGSSGSRGFGDYNNDVHYTSTAGDSASYTFVGKRIDYITEKNSDMGNVDIYIDGVLDQTVNCYAVSRLSLQAVYNKTWATAGTHTINIVKNSGVFMLLDAYKVYN